jgi:3-methylfumaryl-CoA hydratase
LNDPDVAAWIGRSEETFDVVDAGPIRRLAALLDHDMRHWAADVLPPFGHWLYFLPAAPQSQIGADGHAKRGGFLPPIDLPRRMWAGGRITYYRAVPFGAMMRRRSTIANIAAKQGASGAMILPKSRILYIAPPAVRRPPPPKQWRLYVAPTGVALSR